MDAKRKELVCFAIYALSISVMLGKKENASSDIELLIRAFNLTPDEANQEIGQTDRLIWAENPILSKFLETGGRNGNTDQVSD